MTTRSHLLAAAATGAALPWAVPASRAMGREGWEVTQHRGIRPDDVNGRDPLVNPRRGYRYEMSYNAVDLSSPWADEQDQPTDAAQRLTALEAEYGPGADLTQLYFYLWDFATTELPQRALDNIERVFAGLRAKGYQAVLRFAYDDGVRAERRYTVQHIQRHIAQLAPVVARNSDVIAVWQAGFLGAWGEWATSHYRHESYPDAVTAIMTSLVRALPPGMHTQMRHAAKRDMVTNHSILDRIGFHNDYITLGGGLWDYYVPSNAGWPAYLDVSPTRAMDGEMPWDEGQSTDPYAWNSVIPGLDTARRLQTLRWDTLSIAHNATVTLPAWKRDLLTGQQVQDALLPVSDGYFHDAAGASVERAAFEYVRDHLGYRIETRAVRHAVLRGQIPVEVDVVNRGFAAPKEPRPVQLLLLDGTARPVASVPVAADWRNRLPQGRAETDDHHGAPGTTTFSGVLPVPAGARGRHHIAVALPDPALPERGRAVRFANATTAWLGDANVVATVHLDGH
ncbi:DUF4874 domain-containing protein [Streptomyces sp. NPDC047917]|uniref:DUF4874 domain-containing protein n=1 Tax=Streptomyces sp. NPDC047917 TaxID=3365491 RepID=UPI0037148480